MTIFIFDAAGLFLRWLFFKTKKKKSWIGGKGKPDILLTS